VRRQAKASAAPDGLEAAAVSRHYRQTGTQLKVHAVDVDAQTITLGNVLDESVTYRWTERTDSNGFRFVDDSGGAS